MNKQSSFFVDFSRRSIDSGSVINAITLDPDSLAIIDPFTQVFSSPQTRLRLSPRIDYQFGANNTLTFRYGLTHDTSEGDGVGNFSLPSRANDERYTEHSFQATETAVLSAKVVNETRFQFQHQHRHQTRHRSYSVHQRVERI